MQTDCRIIALAAAVLAALPLPSLAQDKGGGDGGIAAIGHTFTYQGVVKQSGTPINGPCDLQFSLWSAAAGPAQIGSTQQFLNQSITAGLVNNDLNFGAAFDGNDRWIEVAVRFPAGGGSYTTLTPRQKINAVPYALWSLGGAGGGGGLTLPYSTVVLENNVPLFQVTNTGLNGAIQGFGGTFGVQGLGYGPTGAGVIGNYFNGNYGEVGRSNAGVFAHGQNGAGLFAEHGPTTNYALLAHPDYGVDGVVTGAEDNGVRGYHSPTGNYGSLGASSVGAFGRATTNSAYGVYGSNTGGGYAGGFDGPVLIGTVAQPAGVMLAVGGKVLCEELEVQLQGDWPDFVFDDDYQLVPLLELEQVIRRDKHLPNVPSARAIASEGISVGQMQSTLLQKVEELTLYLIEVNKELSTIKRVNAQLHDRVVVLEAKECVGTEASQ